MKKHVVMIALAAAALLLVQLAPLRADAAPKPLKVFILAGQTYTHGEGRRCERRAPEHQDDTAPCGKSDRQQGAG